MVLKWKVLSTNQEHLVSIVCYCISCYRWFTPAILNFLYGIVSQEFLFVLFIVRTILPIQFIFLNVAECLVSDIVLHIFVMTIWIPGKNVTDLCGAYVLTIFNVDYGCIVTLNINSSIFSTNHKELIMFQ